MYSIGKLCHEFSLSRSALLYYDSINLLTASDRSQGNYRQYSEEDRRRLSRICTFREAGVPLKHIKDILDTNNINERNILEARLNEINHTIRYQRLQQKFIVEMLKGNNSTDKKMLMDSQTFISILKSTGLDEKAMNHFHIQFEKNSPDFHQLFLEFLALSDEEIEHIRELCGQEEADSK